MDTMGNHNNILVVDEPSTKGPPKDVQNGHHREGTSEDCIEKSRAEDQDTQIVREVPISISQRCESL